MLCKFPFHWDSPAAKSEISSMLDWLTFRRVRRRKTNRTDCYDFGGSCGGPVASMNLAFSFLLLNLRSTEQKTCCRCYYAERAVECWRTGFFNFGDLVANFPRYSASENSITFRQLLIVPRKLLLAVPRKMSSGCCSIRCLNWMTVEGKLSSQLSRLLREKAFRFRMKKVFVHTRRRAIESSLFVSSRSTHMSKGE